MIRRAILVVAAAVALILVPSAAMAYRAPGFSISVSDSTPAAGVPFTAVITGAEPGSVVTLPITGVAGQTLTATANASGVATFAVAAAAAPAVPTLSSTGFDGMPLAIGGGVLVLAGTGAVLVARRRKSEQVSV